MWIADPKAIHHILHSTSYLYEKTHSIREVVATLTDRGLGTVEGEFSLVPIVVHPLILGLGDAHKRQRRAMIPAFGLVESKALYPCFTRCADSVSSLSIHTRNLGYTIRWTIARR